MDQKSRTVAAKKLRLGANPSTSQPSRGGQVNITGYFDVSVRSSLHLIQAKHPKAQLRHLLAEALNLLFEKHGVPQTAPKPEYDEV
jgi:hypothetical protein